MEPFIQAIRQMIVISEEEMNRFQESCYLKSFRRNEVLSEPGKVPDEIYFIISGIVRVIILDIKGGEHTIYFALENQFIADYSGFMQKIPSVYSLQAVEATQVVVLPRSAIEWGYENLRQGDRLGRLVAEFYFVYHDNRIKNMYSRTPKERYDMITQVFPDIHNRVPQHMIASYLGITPVHLSRLKKAAIEKV
ncbi:MAG: Crp/Fnr family transcriptional regulator [Bacteroidia bacterium]|nr:Crp/Fnr family transcriptional regulator [Bacteroidia bacterium]